MSTYRPTVWSRKYQQLSPTARDLVNKLTNEVFRVKTGVNRRLWLSDLHLYSNFCSLLTRARWCDMIRLPVR